MANCCGEKLFIRLCKLKALNSKSIGGDSAGDKIKDDQPVRKKRGIHECLRFGTCCPCTSILPFFVLFFCLLKGCCRSNRRRFGSMDFSPCPILLNIYRRFNARTNLKLNTPFWHMAKKM